MVKALVMEKSPLQGEALNETLKRVEKIEKKGKLSPHLHLPSFEKKSLK